MSNTSLNYFLARGTNAERLAYTPTDIAVAAGPDMGFLFYETDTNRILFWNGASWDDVGGTSPVAVAVAGALSGDGSAGSPLEVSVDGVSVTINGSNQLQAVAGPHAASHQNGGGDEISVTGLSGLLADPQIPVPHASRHQNGGDDEINVDGLSGELADPQTVATDPAGALDGLGNAISPLAVLVDGVTVIVNDDNQLAAIQPGGNEGSTFSQKLSGGQIVWVDDFDFIVSAATYSILGVPYSSPQTNITLDAADPSDSRIDVVVVTTGGVVLVIAGTPSSQPAEPDVDPSTQLKLGIILVPAGATQPTGAAETVVYAENAGSPGEWNWTSSGSGWTLNSTNNPATGTTDIEATTITTGAYVQGQIGSGALDPTTREFLRLKIRSKANWTNNRSMQVRLQSTGVVVGATISIQNGQFGFDSASVAAYQQIAIPMSLFAVPGGSTVNQIRLTRVGGGTIGFYLDDISFVSSGGSVPGGGLTLEQADARYIQIGQGGSGDVVGPSGATADHVATFNGTTGKIIKDGGKTIATILSDADAAAATRDAALALGITTLTGDVDAGPGSGSQAATIGNDKVTYAKMQNVSATSRILGRKTSGAGDPEECTLSEILDFISSAAQGDILYRGSSSWARLAAGTSGQVLKTQGSSANPVWATLTAIVGATLATVGEIVYVEVPFAMTITAARIVADASGSAVVDVWKDTYSNFPPTVADTITASAKPTLSSAQKSQDTTLTGWTTSVSAGDWIAFKLESMSTATKVVVTLTGTRT